MEGANPAHFRCNLFPHDGANGPVGVDAIHGTQLGDAKNRPALR